MHYQNEQGQSIIVGISSSGTTVASEEIPGAYEACNGRNIFTRVGSPSKRIEAQREISV